jgi:hypothetical protein
VLWSIWLGNNILFFQGGSCKSIRSIDVISLAKCWNTVKDSQFNYDLHLVLPLMFHDKYDKKSNQCYCFF